MQQHVPFMSLTSRRLLNLHRVCYLRNVGRTDITFKGRCTGIQIRAHFVVLRKYSQ